jgi:hypothetical protein
LTIIFGFLICIFILVGISSFKNGIGVSGAIIFGVLTCLSIAGWIFFLNRYHKWSEGLKIENKES